MKPLVQVKSKGHVGCKLLGSVNGAKVWVGDCIANEPTRPNGSLTDSDGRREEVRQQVAGQFRRFTERQTYFPASVLTLVFPEPTPRKRPNRLLPVEAHQAQRSLTDRRAIWFDVAW